MSLKDKIAERALGGVTNKAMKGLQPFMESIHTRLELQNELLKELLIIKYRTEYHYTEEEAQNEIKRIIKKVAN